MKITAISDLHGYKPKLPGGDLLLLCGDYTAWDKISEWVEFFEWLKKQSYTKKILISGNHDRLLESGLPKTQEEADELKEVQSFLRELDEMEEPDFEYLCDSGTEFEGLKIWGSPWTNLFDGVNPSCTAFMVSETMLHEKFRWIPEGLDILITHSPPHNILDESYDNYRCGSISLTKRVFKVNPRYHFFGHIHECGGQNYEYDTEFYNVSYCDRRYKPRPEILTLDIQSKGSSSDSTS